MESFFLPDFVSDFDNNPFGSIKLEDASSLIDSLSDRDLLLFEKELCNNDEGHNITGGHIQQGVINFSISKILQNEEPRHSESKTTSQDTPHPSPNCVICTKPALKYCSYGAQACTSCRSFFRRSARNDVHLNYKLSVIKGPNLNFTKDERFIMEDIHNKFEVAWLENFIMLNRDAAVNWMEYTFCGQDLDCTTWRVLGASMLHNFTTLIMPQFPVLTGMSSKDFNAFCQISCQYVSFFREEFTLMSSEHNNDGVLPYISSLSQQLKNISKNKILVKEYNLEDLIRKIEDCDLHDVKITTYSQHYPQSDLMVETIKRVQRWPRMKDGTWSPFLISIMSLILALSINLNMFTSSKLMETVQLQYTHLLQRYLKFTLLEEEANNKFLAGMLLLADVKETNENVRRRFEPESCD